MYLVGFPLLLIPFAIYNMIAFLFRTGFNDTVFTIPMLSKATLNVTTSDLLLILSICPAVRRNPESDARRNAFDRRSHPVVRPLHRDGSANS